MKHFSFSMKSSLLCFSFAFLIFPLQAQWTIGIGGLYGFPQSTRFKDVNSAYPAGSFFLLNRRYCHLWYGIRISYAPLERAKDIPPDSISYRNASEFALILRWYPWDPLDIPFYITGNLGISDISYTPRIISYQQTGSSYEEPSPLGLGYRIGIGYLIPYTSHCCDWFLDLALHYHSYNGLWKSEKRPEISSFLVQLGIHIKL